MISRQNTRQQAGPQNEPPPALPPRNVSLPAQNPLCPRSQLNIYCPATIEQRIRRNILPDIVCDSFTRGVYRRPAPPSPPQRLNSRPRPVPAQRPPALPSASTLHSAPPTMGQRTSVQPKPNISFAWVLRGDQSSSASTSTDSSSIYKKTPHARTIPEWKSTDNDSFSYSTISSKHRRKHRGVKGNKHHLFSEKNLKDSDFHDDFRFRRALIEGDSLSLSTTETTSISKCVDKATNVKKKRYRSKTRLSKMEEEVPSPQKMLMETRMPGLDDDTSQFDEYLRKCSLLCPANLPMLLVCDTIMYQTRVGYQTETFLPLGTMINGIFSVQDWIYIQLPGKVDQSGYVMASSCIPMGVAPSKRQRCKSDSRFSKSTTDLSGKLLSNNFRASTLNPKLHQGPEFQALYARVMEKLKSNSFVKSDENQNRPDCETRKYSLSAQNLQKFNVLSCEALKQETEKLAANFDSLSLKNF